MNRLIIVGASGHGKVIADIAIRVGYKEIVFLDDNDIICECAGFPVVGKSALISELKGDKIIAIGNAQIRQKILERADVVTLIHPDAVVGRNVEVGAGTVIMPGAVINADTKIGAGCIINTCASVDHDCMLGNFVHIAVGAHVAGTCMIGERTWIGAGATISNNIKICEDCTIGAGAVVVRNISKTGTYVGCPAQKIK